MWTPLDINNVNSLLINKLKTGTNSSPKSTLYGKFSSNDIKKNRWWMAKIEIIRNIILLDLDLLSDSSLLSTMNGKISKNLKKIVMNRY